MPNHTWKAVERSCAAIFGTVRIPPAVNAQRADRGDNAPDAETDTLSIQIKHSYRFPGYLKEWLDGIKKTTVPGKVPVVCWHPKGARFTDSLILVRAEDFSRLVAAAGVLDAIASAPLPAHVDTPPDR